MILLTDREFHLFTEFIYQHFGLHITGDKRTLLAGRLQHVLAQYHLNSFSELYEALISDTSGSMLTELLNRITTNHTYFMREKEHFAYVQSTVLPYLAHVVKDKDLRIWSAGCSTGEEPYTLSMLIHDHFRDQIRYWDTDILASDISMQALEKARKGIYERDRVDLLPSHWKISYFNKQSPSEMKVSDMIRKRITFRQFNLMQESFPFRRKFHMIFCRNVMIYFDQATKLRLVRKFYDHLEVGGYLFIGQSESLQRNETEFQYMMPSVYRKV